jgi:hypothetical protein
MKFRFWFICVVFLLGGCQIDPEKDFDTYKVPSEKEIIGTYEFYEPVWKGPFWVLKLDPDKSYLQFTVDKGIVGPARKGTWTYEGEKASGSSGAYLDLFIGHRDPKTGKLIGGTGNIVRKRVRDGKIFICCVDSPGSEEEYFKVK